MIWNDRFSIMLCVFSLAASLFGVAERVIHPGYTDSPVRKGEQWLDPGGGKVMSNYDYHPNERLNL